MTPVDLMGDAVWTDDDIIKQTEAMITSQFSINRTEILRRKVIGQLLGRYTLTDEENADLDRYEQVAKEAGDMADAMRADNALLAEAIRFEREAHVLVELPDPPADAPDPLYPLKLGIVEDLQSYPPEVKELVAVRNPEVVKDMLEVVEQVRGQA